MKVVFKVIKAGSGNDIYFQRLSAALKKVNIDSEIEYYPKYFQYFPWLLKLVNKRTPADIIHSNVEYGWVFKEKDKPLVVTLLHNVFDKSYIGKSSFLQKTYHYLILKPNTELSLKVANKAVAISNYTKKSFAKNFKLKDVQVVYCCINTHKYRPIQIKSTDKRFKLLFVGNLIKRKGADLLPRIMKRLGENYVLYYTTGLRTKIPQEFNLPNMIPLGKLSEEELIREYNKSDALLFPSRLEGFGYAVAEAMSCGKPIIATNTSSIPELVENPVNGYLCNLDKVNEFVEKISFMSKDKKRKYIQNNRAKIVKNFEEYHIAKQYEELVK